MSFAASPLGQVDRCRVCLHVRTLSAGLCTSCSAELTPRTASLVQQARRNPVLAQAMSQRLSQASRSELVRWIGHAPGIVGPSVASCRSARTGARRVG
ncbi:MAG: hypothetical protein KIT72_03000 [Polyangiaceae bacterium]|nr:hypothetical protein [Polyangiaceae bacterium]MCW5789368.1 hypothetical protein [Polyangiaceae bacterium]